MAGSWEPSKDVLLKTLETIRVSQWSKSKNQEAVQQELKELDKCPVLDSDLQRHLMFVLTKLTDIDEKSRVQGGFILDSNIKTHFHCFPAELIASLKSECLTALDDPSPVIRETALSLIKTISFKIEKLADWPDMVPRVCQMLNLKEHCDSVCALNVLHFISQEYASEIVTIDELHKELIPKFIQFLNHISPIIRARSLDCMMQLLRVDLNHILMIYVEKLFLGLLEMMKIVDDNKMVREKVCHSLNYVLLQYRHICPDLLVPHMDTIVKYVLDVSSVTFTHEICEFWVQLAENRGLCIEFLKQEHLIQLVPILLKGLEYSESEIVVLLKDDLEEGEDLFHLNMKKGVNLTREMSGKAVRGLSKVFKEDLLRRIWPIIQEMFHHSEPRVNNAAIVAALEFIADGCETENKTYSPMNLIPLYLIASQSRSALTSIDHHFEHILKMLIKGIVDGNKLVQLNACSALTAVQRKVSTVSIVPHLGSILEALVAALAKYQRKNRIILYSTIASLADAVGNHLNIPKYIHLLLPPLMTTWKALKDDDKDMLPLMECLASVAKAVESGFLRYDVLVFDRCVSLMLKHFRNNEVEIPKRIRLEAQDQNFIIRPMELLSGLAQGLGTHIHRLAETSYLMELLRQNVKDSRHGVRQASFTLLGHLANASFGLVDAHLQYFLPILGKNLDHYLDFPLLYDEAVQTLGKIAVKFGERMNNYITLFRDRLIAIMNDHRAFEMDYLLRQHTAVTLGRLGASCPKSVAPRLEHLSQKWCMSMESVVDEALKQSAFLDMCALIVVNPGGIVKDFVPFCGVIGSFTVKPPDELKKKIVNTLGAIKAHVGDEKWKRLVIQVPPMILLFEYSD